MIEFLRELFSSDFMGHGYCYLWKRDIIWLHGVSDGLIALAYYVIPVTLVYFVRKRRDLPFHWMFFMFGIFIFGCGTAHAMEIWTLWHGTYRLAGVIKALTAAASVTTAVALVPLIPRALLLPSPGQLRAANLELEREIAERLRAEEALQQRTAELAQANERMEAEIVERRRAEQLFRLAVEATPNAIVMADHEGKMVLVNSQTEKLFGYGREELLGQPVEILALGPSRNSGPGLTELLVYSHATPMGVGWNRRAQRRDGRQFPVEISFSPIETGERTWVLSSIMDITFDRQRVESLGVLAGGIAHDFNNLLGSILADYRTCTGGPGRRVPLPRKRFTGSEAVAIRAAEIVRELMIYAGQEQADSDASGHIAAG